jgi:DNA polymerase I-like protein with 3'-5' exonuclease and polymerase domains
MRLLAELMWRYDKGEYAKVVLDGDPHERNRAAMEIPSRSDAKNTFYALIYGAANKKLGKVSGTGDGQLIRDRLQKNLPAMDQVIKDVTAAAVQNGYVVLLDGRRAPLREKHKALNTQIQGNAAVVHKLWFALCCKELEGLGARWMLNVHDELQVECGPKVATEVGTAMVRCAARAGEILKVKIPIGAEYKIGNNWAETH